MPLGRQTPNQPGESTLYLRPGNAQPRILYTVLLTLAMAAVAVVAFVLPAPAKTKRADRDGDGLSNRAERTRFHTSPRKRDTDKDGLKDGAEIRRYKTKPRRRDTDRDRLSDGREVKRLHTNPRRKDTDGDGLRDGAEVRRFKTNPRKKDTDGDGVPDGVEVFRGTNPRKRDSRRLENPSAPSPRACNTVVSSLSAAESAVAGAAPGSVVCLANGSYGRFEINASKSSEVMLQAQHVGGATLDGATLGGSNLTVARFRMTGAFEPRPGSSGMKALHNYFDLNAYRGYGVMACASDDTMCSDISIIGNRFIGRAEEDAIRANRYHDGPDADANGLLIEGNEFAGNQETGEHNDVFQSVWVGDHLVFRGNYLHDFGGQGFFVKDQNSAINGLVVENNLIVRQNLPCNPTSLCPNWQLSPFQIFGPLRNVSIRHNTVWPGPGQQWLRGSGWQGPTVVSQNVFRSLNSDASGLTNGYSASDNSRCGGSGFPSAGLVSDCSPAFNNPGAGDWRQPNGRGVTWAVGQRHFGP
jgi:hypothetical protein